MSTLLLPQGFPTGVYIESPDTGKKRLYEFKNIIDEEFESIDRWMLSNPDASKHITLFMLERLALGWAAEDLVKNQDMDMLLTPKEITNLKITYVL